MEGTVRDKQSAYPDGPKTFVEVIEDDGRDRQIRQCEPMGWGQVRERAVEVVVEQPARSRRLRLLGGTEPK